MIDFVIANMAPIMFLALVVFLLLGYPVSFSLSFVGLAFAALGIGLGLFEPVFLQLLPERVWQVMSNETLLAVPFFTFMGLILERSGMAEELLDTAGKLFGPIRGGLAYAVVFVGALLAATTGVVAASVIAMGLISLPIMLRYGYDRRLASGVIAASGTLAQIIPPSLVLIILADQLGRSVGDMYKGALIPGLILTGLYALHVLVMTLVFPRAAPALPPDARSFGEGASYGGVMRAATLPLVLLVYAMASLFSTTLGLVIVETVTRGLAGRLLPQLLAPDASKAMLLLAPLAVMTVIHGVYLVLLRHAPRPLGVAAALGCFALAALLAREAATIAGMGLDAVPPIAGGFAERVWLVASVVWVPWINYFAVLGLCCAGFALLGAPDRPVAAAVGTIVWHLLPPLILIFLVLGTIFQGIAAPTEGGAMGAMGALLLALSKRRLTYDLTSQALDQTAKLSAFVIFILIGARVFSLTFYGVDGHKWVEALLLDLPGGQLGFLIVVNALVFVLAFFLDFFELAFIVVPLLAPVATQLGIDLIWFGVLLGINMQTSFMHPPFGFALFYLRSVAPTEPYLDKVTGKRMAPVTTGQIYWGAVPFVFIQVLMVAIAIMFPRIVMHYKDGPIGDPARIEIVVPPSGSDGGVTPAPDFGTPAPPSFD